MAQKSALQTIKPKMFNNIYTLFFLLLPVVYSFQIIDPVLIPRMTVLTVFVIINGIIVINWIFRKKLVSDFTFLKSPLPVFLAIFCATILLSFFQSIAVAESIFVFSKVAVVTIFFIMTTYLLIQNKIDFQHIVKAIIGLSIILILIAFFQLFKLLFSGVSFWNNVQLINSTISNKNLFSSLLFLILPFLFSAIILKKSWKILSVILFVLIMGLLWVIQTKAAIIATLVYITIFLFLSLKYLKNNIKKRSVKIAIISFSLFILFAGFFTLQNKQKFSHMFNKNSATSRFLIWDNSVQMIKENPVFGVGAGNWQINFPKYGLNKLTSEQQNGLENNIRPHNDFLWIFSEMGVFGVISYLLMFCLTLYYLIRLLMKSKNRDDYWIYSAFFASIIGYIIISFLDFPFERIEHLVLLYLIFSVVTYKYYVAFIQNKASKKIMINPYLLSLMLIVICLFSLVVCVYRYSGEYHTKKLNAARKRSNWVIMSKEADKAINFFYVIDPTSAPIAWHKGVALFSTGNVMMAAKSFEVALNIHPYNIHVLNNYASCCEIAGDHKKAEELYLRALAISPLFEETRLNLTAVYFNIKDYKKAFETIDKCSINCSDPKYKTFLNAILNVKLDNIASKQKEMDVLERLLAIKNSQGKILDLYFEAKRKNMDFETYILNH